MCVCVWGGLSNKHCLLSFFSFLVCLYESTSRAIAVTKASVSAFALHKTLKVFG